MKTIDLPYPSHSADFTPWNFRIFFEMARHRNVFVGYNLQMKLKVHHKLNQRTGLKMDSRNVLMNFKSDGKSLLLLKCPILKDDVFQQFNWFSKRQNKLTSKTVKFTTCSRAAIFNIYREWIPKQKTMSQHKLLKVRSESRIAKIVQSNRRVSVLQIVENLNQAATTNIFKRRVPRIGYGI
ncbi:hypothetical protein TNCV_3352251 [Trichonephila clavipes]|nr:hypothetical protein TNCV_3352251 [Trichonephila clavipes]